MGDRGACNPRHISTADGTDLVFGYTGLLAKPGPSSASLTEFFDGKMRHITLDYRNRVCKAMNFISRNLDQDLSLGEIAEAASFSMFHFHRIFKAVVGENVAGFKRRLRLESGANRLIAFPHKDITSIALACGFSNSQSFAKAFRQHFGSTPSQFRKSKIGHNVSKNGSEFSIQTQYDPDTVFTSKPETGIKINLDVKVKTMPEYHVAYVRKLGNYDKQTHDAAFDELMQWAVPRGYTDSGINFGLYWDNPDVTPEGKCRIDACISVPAGTIPEGQIGIQTISGGPYAVMHENVLNDTFKESWELLFKWIVQKGYEFTHIPNYQIYLNDGKVHPQGTWIVDICVPLRSGN